MRKRKACASIRLAPGRVAACRAQIQITAAGTRIRLQTHQISTEEIHGIQPRALNIRAPGQAIAHIHLAQDGLAKVSLDQNAIA